MRNNRTAYLPVLASAFAVSWMIVGSPYRAVAQAPAPSAQPPAGQAPAASPGATAEAPAEPPTEAERLIDAAIKKIAAVKSVSADLQQNVKMLGQKFEIKGRYLKAPASKVYLKMSISGLPGSTGTMLQVCDGEVLWDYQQILEAQEYRRLSVKPIFERLNSPDIDPVMRDQVLGGLGFAGPETLLLGLRKSIKFDQKEEGDWQGMPVYILRGTWRNREGLIGPDQQPVRPIGWLPAYVPSQANLYIGKENGWPYKLELLGKVASPVMNAESNRRRGPDGRIQGRPNDEKPEPPSEILLIYSNVQLNPTIRPEEFAFQAPANANVQDNTEVITKTLDNAINMQAMQKRAEAAKKEGSVLEQPLEIPTPSATPEPPK
ncbi:MAG: hypothetical protein P4L85_19040 [Paludisphaera borealis]|uniref:hypothetical protein n=1 Tax=Paludisphaera borealis TaxID=1387353 RepID=UPI00284C2B9A|nr:hypothetical protein [Paludisphaera borealis]MDR3621454.1 hypothetical protein [Paludisphaera borealis]